MPLALAALKNAFTLDRSAGSAAIRCRRRGLGGTAEAAWTPIPAENSATATTRASAASSGCGPRRSASEKLSLIGVLVVRRCRHFSARRAGLVVVSA